MLHQAMVTLGYSDDLKRRYLSFLFNLGLLSVDVEKYVRLHVPQAARSIDFYKMFPLAVSLVAAHDNLRSYRLLRQRHRQKRHVLGKKRALQVSESAGFGSTCSPVDYFNFVDDDAISEQEASILDSSLTLP
jgi:hypothetical protein